MKCNENLCTSSHALGFKNLLDVSLIGSTKPNIFTYKRTKSVTIYVNKASKFVIWCNENVKKYAITDPKQYENFPFKGAFEIFIIFRDGALGLFYIPYDLPLIEFFEDCGFNLNSDYYVSDHLFTKEQLHMTPSSLKECYNLQSGFVINEKSQKSSFRKPPVFTKDVKKIRMYKSLWKTS